MSRNLESRPYTTWQLIKSYWQSEERFFAYSFFIAVLVMTITMVGLEVALTNWYNYFYNALQDYDKPSVIDLMKVFIFLAALLIVLAVYRYYLQSFLGLRWRKWLTKQFISRWLSNRSYYYLEYFDEDTDNPDQRIQEDVGALVNYTLDLIIGVVNSVVTIVAFIYVLWTLSGVLTIPLGKWGSLHLPGYLVWVAILYATIGTLLTFKIGHPLVQLNFEQQRREANFRYAAVDLRNHGENVALYRGETQQNNVLTDLLYRLLNNWYLIILRQKLLLWFTAGYNQVSVLVPLVVALPNYFSKVFKLGGLIQTLAAFRQIQDALSFLVNAYTRIAEWQAVCRRLVTFLNHMHQIEVDAEARDHFVFETGYQNEVMTHQHKIITKNVMLYTPQGEKLLNDISEEFIHGHNYWIKGPSGIGKSTYVRAISGIWPYGSGKIILPPEQNIMFLPQRPYMPIGTLRQALLFPDTSSSISDNELAELLVSCGLSRLPDHLHEVKHWSENLSPGELQRIAFARILLHKPDWAFLDETTSALDLKYEKYLYELLKEKLPACSIISVGHRPSLAEFHEHHIDMEKYAVKLANEIH